MIYLYFDVASLMLTYMEIHYKGEYFQVKYAEFRCRQICIAAYANKGELNLNKIMIVVYYEGMWDKCY
mgnify:CR=1 FL=1